MWVFFFSIITSYGEITFIATQGYKKTAEKQKKINCSLLKKDYLALSFFIATEYYAVKYFFLAIKNDTILFINLFLQKKTFSELIVC